MSTPDGLLENTRFARLDDIPVYEIDGMIWPSTRPYTDDLGREWMLTKGGDKGFLAPAAPRTRREDRADAIGSYVGPERRGSKTVALAGSVWVPRGLRTRTELELAALCCDPARTYTLRRRTGGGSDLVREVKLDGEPDWDWDTVHRLSFSLGFFAPDPRKHDWAWQQPVCSPPQPTAGGLSFPLNFGGGGLNFGTPQLDSAVAQVGNYGTAPAHPLLRLDGPLPTPAVLHRESGRALRYVADIEAGETLQINCDDFPQGGIPAHGVLSSVRGNVATLLVRDGRDWPVVDPQAAASFALRSYGQAGAALRVGLRSAYW